MIDYFFSGSNYIRVTRGNTALGAIDPGYPKPISTWNSGARGRIGIVTRLPRNASKSPVSRLHQTFESRPRLAVKIVAPKSQETPCFRQIEHHLFPAIGAE
jgi:hypothetical protein